MLAAYSKRSERGACMRGRHMALFVYSAAASAGNSDASILTRLPFNKAWPLIQMLTSRERIWKNDSAVRARVRLLAQAQTYRAANERVPWWWRQVRERCALQHRITQAGRISVERGR